MREYLDNVIRADQCAQYVDDIGIAANTVAHLIHNIRAVFECLRNAGLKLTIEKCHFGVIKVEFLGRTITPLGTAPQDHKIKKFLANVPEDTKTSPTMHWIHQLLLKLYTETIRETEAILQTSQT